MASQPKKPKDPKLFTFDLENKKNIIQWNCRGSLVWLCLWFNLILDFEMKLILVAKSSDIIHVET